MSATAQNPETVQERFAAHAMASVVEDYTRLREQCYQAAQRDNGALMGDSAWLVNAMEPNEIQMSVTEDGIRCSGMTWTSQTQGNEWFEFTIPFAALLAA